jgi:plastocyanin
MRTLLIAGIALTMGACVPATSDAPTVAPPLATAVPTPARAAATEAPAAPPTAVAVVKRTPAPAVAAAPTPTFERVADREPRVAAPQPHGLLTWRDDTLRNDSLLVSAEDLPSLSNGQVYAAWLSGKDDNLFLGTLAPGQGGAQVLNFAATDHVNLLSAFDRLTVSRVAPTQTGQPASDAVLAGGLPEKALVHVRHVLVGIPATPDGVGFVIGLRQQTEELLRHAQFLKEAQDEGNLANEKLHAEHLVNLIEGAQGEHYGDLNGNGKVENPGDGFGVLQNGAQDGYLKGMGDHAQLAAAAPDATQEIKLHAGHVQIAGDNTRIRTSEIRDRALGLLVARMPNDTRSDVQKVLALAQQTVAGLDLNGDEQIAPVPGEGGVVVAYQHAQLMAGIPLKRPTAAPAAASAVVVVPTPTAIVQAAVAAAAGPVKVVIGDNTYTAKDLNVPVGTKVVWSHEGQKPHTVTADDTSFASDLLKNGAAFEHVFSQVGTFLYYCELHGGPGGAGMAAEINVK